MRGNTECFTENFAGKMANTNVLYGGIIFNGFIYRKPHICPILNSPTNRGEPHYKTCAPSLDLLLKWSHSHPCQKRLTHHTFVYSAERRTSMGKDWHRECLKCDRCSKTLSPGSHSEVRVSWHMLIKPEFCFFEAVISAFLNSMREGPIVTSRATKLCLDRRVSA